MREIEIRTEVRAGFGAANLPPEGPHEPRDARVKRKRARGCGPLNRRDQLDTASIVDVLSALVDSAGLDVTEILEVASLMAATLMPPMAFEVTLLVMLFVVLFVMLVPFAF